MGVGAEAEDLGTPWQVAEREARRPALGDALADHDRMTSALSPEHRELYAPHLAGNRALLGRTQKLVGDPAKVVSAVEKALTARRPRARYRCDNPSRAQVAFATVTPTAASDALLATVTTSRKAQRA